jgi:phospho-N-acetylmuramoyl-pentapeptide-transferase
VRPFAAFFVAFAVGILLLQPAIKFSRARKIGQVLRSREEVRDLANLHAAKANTPIFGGVCIWASTLFAAAILSRPNGPLVAAVFVFTAFCAIGLADDVAKLCRHSSCGIPGKLKLLLEALVVCAMLLAIGAWDADLSSAIHELHVPTMGTPAISHMANILLYPFAFLVIAGAANGVNLSDGADGLAAGCSPQMAWCRPP